MALSAASFRSMSASGIMAAGRPPALAGMTMEETAVWDRSYNSSYKRAWNAGANAYKVEHRRALQGDAVESSSSSSLAPKEVATVAARPELSRFLVPRQDRPLSTPAAESRATTTSALHDLLSPILLVPLLFGATAPSDLTPPHPRLKLLPSSHCLEEEPELLEFAAVCGVGARKMRRALSLCGPADFPKPVLARCVDSVWVASLAVDVMRYGTWVLGDPVDVVRVELSRGGAGIWVIGGGQCALRAALALGEAAEAVRSMLEVIFNTTSAPEAKERSADNDSGLQ